MNLAPLRYRRVLADDGGPIASCACAPTEVLGRRLFLANATLTPGLRESARDCVMFANADGSGTDERPLTARHRAISEALERWAHAATWRTPDAARFGFDVDCSTNGMAAFPGLFARQARDPALGEAAERFAVSAWWSGASDAADAGEIAPGVRAWRLDNPLSRHVVALLHAAVGPEFPGRHAYATGAGRDFAHAVHRTAIELERTQLVLRVHAAQGAAAAPPANMLEQRLHHFSTPAGHAEFAARLARRAWRTAAPEIVFDGEIPGPWSRWAHVWRVALRPVSDDFLDPAKLFFFW